MDLLLLLKAALLGVIEGATEFIPVSSTGHLVVAQSWLGYTGPTAFAFTVVIQLGAILAVVWLYREKILSSVLTLHTKPASRKLWTNVVLGTLPAVAIGLPLDDWVEAHLFKPVPVALAFIVGGMLILVVERLVRQPKVQAMDDIPVRGALGVGLLQVLAVVWPGMSRSGSTILGGLALGLSRRAAAEFSFFLAIPAMCGASLLKLLDVRDLLGWADLPVFATGFVVSFLVALVVIRALLAFVGRHSFAPFAWYRIAAGCAVLLVAWLG